MDDELMAGWLSPNGDLTPCRCYEHIGVARKLCRTYGYDCKAPLRPCDVLLHNRWVKITILSLLEHGWHFDWGNFLTESQKNFLKQYFYDNNLPVTELTKIRWEKECE